MNEPVPGDHFSLVKQVIGTLDAGIRRLDDKTLSRLYANRRAALSTLQARHSGGGVLAFRRHPALWSMGLATLLLGAGWLVMHMPMPSPPASPDTSELDIQLLTGQLPPQVFADWSLVTRENVEAVCLTDT